MIKLLNLLKEIRQRSVNFIGNSEIKINVYKDNGEITVIDSNGAEITISQSPENRKNDINNLKTQVRNTEGDFVLTDQGKTITIPEKFKTDFLLTLAGV